MDSLEVGSGNGSLNIQNGGLVNAGSTFIGTFGGSSGTTSVSGANSQLTGYQLDVGYQGQGSLAITAGGQVNDVIGFVGATSGSVGNVLVDAGTWTNSALLDIGVGGTGVVTVKNGGSLSAGSIEVGGGGSLNIDPAIVDVSGGFILDSGGILSLDIAGITPGLISQLDISGFGLFEGTIDLDFVNGFAPTTGESFDLINALGANFSNATIQIEGLAPGFQYSDSFFNGQFTLVADNNGVSTTTPEPGSMWLAATALGVLSLTSLVKKLKSESQPAKGTL
jgi:T5SS/PEP-CTERM-associated repeat protein